MFLSKLFGQLLSFLRDLISLLLQLCLLVLEHFGEVRQCSGLVLNFSYFCIQGFPVFLESLFHRIQCPLTLVQLCSFCFDRLLLPIECIASFIEVSLQIRKVSLLPLQLCSLLRKRGRFAREIIFFLLKLDALVRQLLSELLTVFFHCQSCSLNAFLFLFETFLFFGMLLDILIKGIFPLVKRLLVGRDFHLELEEELLLLI
mmetsp:Transcript_11183/g.22475  ORF Transcript_11183/g.22475 Transcript_11183/m.22475 type:complete len:202 (-) Transcript_11183:2025-2630(-)